MIGILYSCIQENNATFKQAAESELVRDMAYANYYKIWLNLIITSVLPLGNLSFERANCVISEKKRKVLVCTICKLTF